MNIKVAAFTVSEKSIILSSVLACFKKCVDCDVKNQFEQANTFFVRTIQKVYIVLAYVISVAAVVR